MNVVCLPALCHALKKMCVSIYNLFKEELVTDKEIMEEQFRGFDKSGCFTSQ